MRLICIVFALLALALPAGAQTISVLRPGDWVRVQPEIGDRTSGMVAEILGERLRVETGKSIPVEFRLSEIARLELSLGRDRARGAKIGATVGGIGGVVAGALTSILGIPRGGGASFAVIGFPLVTTPAGAVLGALIAPHQYVDVSASVLGR